MSRSTCPAWRWSNCARKPARFISTPASSRGRADIPTPACRLRPALTMRFARMRWRCAAAIRQGPTAVLTHGANPGLVSHFVKQALVDLARDAGLGASPPQDARRLGAIGPAPRHQGHPYRRTGYPGRGDAESSRVNSSTPGRSTALSAKARSLPNSAGARMNGISRRMGAVTISAASAAIYLLRPGAATRVRSWTPLEGSVSWVSDHPWRVDLDRRLSDRAEGERSAFPSDLPLCLSPMRRCGSEPARIRRQELAVQDLKRLMMGEITTGTDELGVLLMGPPRASIGSARA